MRGAMAQRNVDAARKWRCHYEGVLVQLIECMVRSKSSSHHGLPAQRRSGMGHSMWHGMEYRHLCRHWRQVHMLFAKPFRPRALLVPLSSP